MDDQIRKYFQGELSQSERLEMLQNVASDEVLKELFIDFQNTAALLNLSDYNKNPDAGKLGFIDFEKKIKRKKSLKLALQIIGYAAAMAILVISSSLITLKVSKPESIENTMSSLFVPAGQRARMTLPDGTLVWLNAKSTLTYPSHFSGKERRVTIDGEAFFEVAKNENKPFIVSSQGIETKVLGTKFNIFSYPGTGYIKTSLIEGKVKIYYSNDELNAITLHPNQQAICEKGHLAISQIENPEYFLWKDGIYYFQNEKLSSIIKKLELYYDTRIIVRNSRLLDSEYTGKFRQTDGLNEILHLIQKIQKFSIQKDEKNNTITLR